MYIIVNRKRVNLTDEEIREAAMTYMDLVNEDDHVLVGTVGIYRNNKKIATLTRKQLNRAYDLYMVAHIHN